ncbi:MAG: serine hydrolase [Acidobacteria bacterium]|nr:serine hydrolase [Acidobacteriota bacterium]
MWLAAVGSSMLGGQPVAKSEREYFPAPDSEGGWRTSQAGVDVARLDEAFEFIKRTSKHGGLLVAHRGWLVYERYFGKAHRDATPNNASIGKSFTSVAAGILMGGRPDLFPHGLDQKVFTQTYLPESVFPLSDPRKADIRLGQLLAMTAGIRGNNPGYVHGKQVQLEPAGPDGWLACDDEMAAGKKEGSLNAKTLWCEPGGGYSYATSSPHLASMMIRHVSGKELQDYVAEKLATPMRWGRWGWGYRNQPLRHTPGGGGIAIRPTDMLRYAYLLLRQGRWRDRQLVPAEYVRKCGSLSPYNPHYDYSLQFDVNAKGRWPDIPRDTFSKGGSGGHHIYIIPSQDLVVYKMAGRDDQYSPSNTGIPPVPETVFRYDGSREGWPFGMRLSGEESNASETLARVLKGVRA